MAGQEVKDISLRQTVLTLRHYLLAGLRGWPWVVGGVLVVAGLMVLNALTTPIYYEAKVAFVVNSSNNGGGGNGLGSLLGQISIGSPGAGPNLNRINAFVTSRQLLNDLLLQRAEVDGRGDLIGNHFIRVNEIVDQYDLAEGGGAIALSSDSLAGLSRQERSLMKLLYSHLVYSRERPIVAVVDEITNMLKVTVKTQNEDLTLAMSEGLFTSLTDFYTAEATAPAQQSVDRLSIKADSILNALNQTEYQLATFEDTQLGLPSRRQTLRRSQLSRKVAILSNAYGEIVRNLEAARFGLDQTTPYFKLVEAPFKPLNRRQKDPYEQAAIGAAIGAVAGFLLAALIAFYRDVMNGTEIGTTARAKQTTS